MKQNIVYFTADQMRADTLRHLGNSAAHTPHLDALAQEGVSFANAFCQNPVCVPSRCSFLTGLYPHTLGHRTMHFLQNEDEPNILRIMKEQGYEVIWCGRNDVIPADRDKAQYCDDYFSGMDLEMMKRYIAHQKSQEKTVTTSAAEGYYSFYTGDVTGKGSLGSMDELIVQHALDYLENKRRSGNDHPFFLYVTLGLPHPPYGCERPFYGMTDRCALNPRRPDLSQTQGKPSMLHGIYEKQQLTHWTEDQWNELRATYLDMTAKFDSLFGQLKAKLIETGYDAQTNIFLFSDHGDYTGDYGIAEKVQNCFDEPVCHVPLIIRPAASLNVHPRITPALAELTDLCATVSELTGIALNYTQFGHSLVPVLLGQEEHRREVHCEGGRIHGEEHCMEKGHGRESQYWPRLSTQASEGPEHTKALMLRNQKYKFVKRLYEEDEFYDLEADPMELNNRIQDSAYAGIIRDFERKALKFMMETADYVPNRKDRR